MRWLFTAIAITGLTVPTGFDLSIPVRASLYQTTESTPNQRENEEERTESVTSFSPRSSLVFQLAFQQGAYSNNQARCNLRQRFESTHFPPNRGCGAYSLVLTLKSSIPPPLN